MKNIHDSLNKFFNRNRAQKMLLSCIVISSMVAPVAVYGKSHANKGKHEAVIASEQVSTLPRENPDEISHYTYTLEELGALSPIELRSVDGRRNMLFSMRSDEFVSAAKLKLNYAWSPALIPELSHLKVMLNDELMTSLPLPHENYNGKTGEVALDPSMFIDFNKLTLNLIAHYTRDCEDPVHSTLWANVSNLSKLELTVRHLKLPNDLALLPAPFFDRLDNAKLMLPVVFPSQPGNDVLHAAGVVTSWFGALSSYRGAQFPVLLNTLPKGNGIVMVAGSAPPAGLGLPMVNGPSLAVVSNPLNDYAKLLVVMGRDAKELDIAAQALTLGSGTLTGGFVSVKQMQEIPARKPYDAPGWIPTDRAVHFGELAKPVELQVEGITPDKIAINFNVPPDLFGWRSAGIPVDLHYRYTPRPMPDRSTLNVNINNQFVQALRLSSVPSKLESKVRLPLLIEDGKAISHDLVHIPYLNVYGQNQLQFNYFFDYTKQGACKDVFVNNERGVIDQDSTIDFSSFPHYTAMPNLNFFVNDGFPYTRMADLSETAVVMPDNVSVGEIETYLMVMGRMGRVTGYPALRHVIVSAANIEKSSDKDIIVIGTAGNQPLLAQWADKMHPLLDQGTHSLRLPGPFARLKSRWDNVDLEDAMHRAGDLISKGDGSLGALVGFESPLKHGRSVVAFTGDTPQQIAELAKSMANLKKVTKFNGDLVMQSGDRVESFQMGPTYYVGELPWLTALRWYMSKQPLLMLIFIGVAGLIVAAVAFRYLRKLVAARLEK